MPAHEERSKTLSFSQRSWHLKSFLYIFDQERNTVKEEGLHPDTLTRDCHDTDDGCCWDEHTSYNENEIPEEIQW